MLITQRPPAATNIDCTRTLNIADLQLASHVYGLYIVLAVGMDG